MSQDEQATVSALDAARNIFRAVIAGHNGRVIDMAGDSVLAVFETAASAVNAALEIQTALERQSISAPVDRRLMFRIGVHLGDMIEKPDGSVYGAGINVAARLEGIASPGGIAISDAVRSSVRNRVPATFEDLGRQEMKNIDEPVHAFRICPHPAHIQDDSVKEPKPVSTGVVSDLNASGAGRRSDSESSHQRPSPHRAVRWLGVFVMVAIVLAGVAYAWHRGALSDSNGPKQASIAVLPFVDMSEKRDQEFFSDGLSEELIDRLTNAGGLKVIARTSSFQFKGKSEDMRAIAEKLGVTHLLEGSVRRSGNELRVTAQLIRARDGTHQWSRTYSRSLEDVFKVQDEIARTVAQALSAELRIGPGNDEGRPSTVLAYNVFLEGNYYAARRNRADLAKAIELYKQAIRLDPNYSLAWVHLADAHGTLGENFGLDQDVVEARAAIERALQIDPKLAAAHAVKASLLRSFDWDWLGAANSYRRANELSTDPHRYDVSLAGIGLRFGRIEESVAAKKRALEQNPLDVALLNGLAYELYFAGRYEEAANAFRRVSDLSPSYAGNRALLATALLFQGKDREALDVVEQEPDDGWKASVLPLVYWRLGRRQDSDAALARLKNNFASEEAFQISAAHAFRGETDLAMKWLETAYTQRDSGLQWIKVEPVLRDLHGNPRYQAFVVKMKLDGDGPVPR